MRKDDRLDLGWVMLDADRIENLHNQLLILGVTLVSALDSMLTSEEFPNPVSSLLSFREKAGASGKPHEYNISNRDSPFLREITTSLSKKSHSGKKRAPRCTSSPRVLLDDFDKVISSSDSEETSRNSTRKNVSSKTAASAKFVFPVESSGGQRSPLAEMPIQ